MTLPKRLDSVDLLRGLALLCMTIDHAYDWWLSETIHGGSWRRITEFIGTMAAPTFLVLVGVSMSLAAANYRAQGKTAWQIVWLLVRRGLLVGLWGYVLNFLVYFTGSNWPDVFAFDVLQCIGMGMLLFAPLVAWGPTWSLPVLALGLGWGGQFADRLILEGYAGTLINGNPPIAYFPLLPWLCFIPVGILWGRALRRWRDNDKMLNRLALGLLPVGLLALLGAALLPPSLGYRHPRLVSILFELAVIAWTAAVLHFWCKVPWRRDLVGWLSLMGRETLLLYVLHHLVGFRLFSVFGWVTGRSWRGEYGTFNTLQATLLLCALLVGLVMALHGWSAARRTYPAFGRVTSALF